MGSNIRKEQLMKFAPTAIAAALGLAFSAAAFAQAGTVQRDVNQQNRIEQGLKSGQLTTKEAGKLEREESRVDKMEANAMKDGKVTNAEKRRIEAAENKVSKDIYNEKHNAQTGDPNSVSSK